MSKERNNINAFTLVELLAVIVIIAIVLVIAIPGVTKLISNNYQHAYRINLEALEKATEDYVIQNSIRVTEEEQKIITVNKLIEEKLIKEVRDPQTKGLCEGYVVVSRNGKNNIYEPFLKCGDTYLSDNYDATNLTPPTITLLGDNPTNIYIDVAYSDAGATAVDYQGFDITDKITITSDLNPRIPGEYFITYTVLDEMGNVGKKRRTVNVVDNIPPVITFNPNENNTYSRRHDVAIKVVDRGGVNVDSLKYIWTTSSTEPSLNEFVLDYKTNELISSPTKFTGTYYLWAIAKDKTGNQTIKGSSGFKLDNIKPSITINGNNTINIEKGSVYSDLGATATDNIDTSVAVTATGTINTNIVGTYNIVYNAVDSVGNKAISVTRIVNVQKSEAPVITILGSNPVTIEIKSPYSDAGATAIDNVDGDVTNSITTTSNLNPNMMGTYNITYKVKDNANNEAVVSRIINVVDTIAPTITEVYAGTMLQTDSTFASGTNNMGIYNNSGGGTVVHSRVSMTTPTGSGYAMKIVTSGVASPGLGGFYQIVNSKANGIYMHRIIANIPVGYTIQRASNACGTGATHTWITDQAGTGNWKEYIYITKAGSTGTFSSFGYVYISGTAGTPSNPVTWHVAYAAVHDTTIWGTNNNVMIKGIDSGTGIVGYGINQSSTIEPTYTSITKTNTLAAEIGKVTSNGTYYAWVKDESGNVSNKSFIVSHVDKAGPTITFGTDGYNNVPVALVKTTVTVSDIDSGIDTKSLKYLWSTSSSGISESQIRSSLTNGQELSTPLGSSNDYYLWILSKDIAGNVEIKRSNVFSVLGVTPITCFSITYGDYIDYKITDYTLSEECITDVVIPDRWNNRIISEIADQAFKNKGITSVEFLYSRIKKIGAEAFYNNEIEKFSFTDDMEYIGDGAFELNNLTYVDTFMANRLTELNPRVFKSNLLSSFAIPFNLVSIGQEALANNNINYLVLDNFNTSLTAIGQGAFQNNKISNLYIQKGVENIAINAFGNNLINQGNAMINNYEMLVSVDPLAFANNGSNQTDTITPTFMLTGSLPENIDYIPKKGVNRPKLLSNMTPKKWDGNSWITVDEFDNSWYDYGNRMWANAQTSDGSMWVWIPRYIYNISYGWHLSVSSTKPGIIDVQFSKGLNDNWNSSIIGNIDTGTNSTSSDKKWTNHLAFTFGETELTGIWVAKFEATEASSGSGVVKIIPNAPSWRMVSAVNAFTASRNMETNASYGWGTSGVGIDTHLMKNVEWGAIAYLSRSIYGHPGQIWNNTFRGYTTGCSGSNENAYAEATCVEYNTPNGEKASTTANITGVYDMAGGVREFTAAVIDTSRVDTVIRSAPLQYVDFYTTARDMDTINYSSSTQKKGDAVYETSVSYTSNNAWFNKQSIMPAGTDYWFDRGGSPIGRYSGIFSFNRSNGAANSDFGFRPVLIINTGL